MVFHGAYAELFQDAFEDLMEAVGFVEKDLEPELGVRVPVVSHLMEFPSPPEGDELEIQISIQRLGGASVTFELLAHDQGRLVARAEVVRVCIGEKGNATPIPEELRQAWEPYR